MIEFILSKFGMLLFVFSVAGIMLLFMAHLKDIFIADQGIKLSSVITKQLKEMADSPSLCVSTYVILPRYIDVVSTSANIPSTTALYYFLDVNVVSSNNKKFIVFTVINKKNKRAMSVESFLTDATVYLSTENGIKKIEEGGVRIDPTDTQVLYLIKVTNPSEEGNTHLFLITCKYEKQEANPLKNCFEKIGEAVKSYNAYCVPTGDPYEYVKINE